MNTLTLFADTDEIRVPAPPQTGWAASNGDGASPAAPSPRADLQPSAQARCPRPKLVVVDDDSAFRSQLRELLEEEGFDVVAEGADGGEGIRIALEHIPDVVLMDVRMPVLGGIEAAGHKIQAFHCCLFGGEMPACPYRAAVAGVE